MPFHMWAPDAYEGAPTTVTALMAAGVKAAAFGAFLRVFLQALPSLAAHWQPAVAVLAIVTMVVGNLGALAQSNLKRMLAYSSVAHAGYLMTALVAAPGLGTEAILFYLVTYAAVNLGGFGAFAALTRSGREPVVLSDMAGLSERRPLLAAALTVFLVSLTGVPISGGFVGKFYLFSAAVSAGYAHLAIVGMLMSVVSAYYYLRVVVAMYMSEPEGEDQWSPVGAGAGAGPCASRRRSCWCSGVYPGPLMAMGPGGGEVARLDRLARLRSTPTETQRAQRTARTFSLHVPLCPLCLGGVSSRLRLVRERSVTRGSTATPLTYTPQCRCGTAAMPVSPTLPRGAPASTQSPLRRGVESRW